LSAKVVRPNAGCRRAPAPVVIRMGYYSCGMRTTAPIIIVPILGVELTVIIQFSIHSDSLGGGPSWDGVGYGVLPVTLVCHRKRPIDATSVHVQNPSVAAAGNVAGRPIF